jgi:DNA-binding response OmpR family regulator
MKFIIIEDDLDIVESVSLTIKMGWPESEIMTAGLGNEGVELISRENPDAVILDIGLPDISDFDVIKQVRLFSFVPILVLTVRMAEPDVVKALELGANEYIFKPFRQMEFLARLRLLLRKQGTSYAKSRFAFGKWQFDHYNHRLFSENKEIHLSNTESSILSYLFLNKGKVVTFAALAEVLWEEDYPGCKDAIRVYIRRLRQKIEDDPAKPEIILTKMGIGYYLKDTD